MAQTLKPCNFNGSTLYQTNTLEHPDNHMIFRRALRPSEMRTLLEFQNPLQHLKNPHTYCQIKSTFSHELHVPISVFKRPISLSSHFVDKTDSESVNSDNIQERNNKTKKPLDVVFREAVGLSQKLQESESDSESENNIKELKKKLRNLEIEVKNLDEKKKEEIEDKGNRVSKPGKLSSFFIDNKKRKDLKNTKKEPKREEDATVYKELPPDMVLLADHLYRKGYLKNANFLHNGMFDATCFVDSYARNFLKSAAEKFAKDNNQITQWLSEGELKRVAKFGCPSLDKKVVFSAKALRMYLKIEEDTVCSKCVLNKKCEYVNHSGWKRDGKDLILAIIVRVITLYALEMFPPELVVPEEVKKSASQLLKDILHQSQV